MKSCMWTVCFGARSREILVAVQAALAAGQNIRLHAENTSKNVEYKGSIDL